MGLEPTFFTLEEWCRIPLGYRGLSETTKKYHRLLRFLLHPGLWFSDVSSSILPHLLWRAQVRLLINRRLRPMNQSPRCLACGQMRESVDCATAREPRPVFRAIPSPPKAV